MARLQPVVGGEAARPSGPGGAASGGGLAARDAALVQALARAQRLQRYLDGEDDGAAPCARRPQWRAHLIGQ